MPKVEKKPAEEAFTDLRKESEELKAKIAEAQKRNDMPLDEALGNPGWERRAAEGHLDRPEDEDET